VDISTEQVRLWINQGIGIADRAVKAFERRVEQGMDGMLPGEYALPGEKVMRSEDEVLQDNLSGIGRMLDPRSVAVEMGGEDGHVILRATLSDEGRREMGLKPEPDLSTPAPSCDAPSCDCAEGEDCEASGAVKAEQSYEDLGRAIRETQLKLLRARAEGLKTKPRQLTVTIDGNVVAIQESGPDWHLREVIGQRELLADTAAAIAIQGKRLDGLTVKIDALTERKAEKAETTISKAVEVIETRFSMNGALWIVPVDPDIQVGSIVHSISYGDTVKMKVHEIHRGVLSKSATMGLIVRPAKEG
jgi:hypothetical protein